jgi:hypothetical protein
MSRLVVSALAVIFANTIGIHVGAVGYQPSAPAACKLSAAMARTHQDYDFNYGTLCLAEPLDRQAQVTVGEDVRPQAQQGFPHAPEPYVHSPKQTTLAYEQYGMTAVAACQMPVQETSYMAEQMRVLPMSPRVPHERSTYISPDESLPTQLACQQPQQHQQRRGSSRRMPLAKFAYDDTEMRYMHAPDWSNGVHVAFEMDPHSYHDSMPSQAYTYSSDLASQQPPSTHPSLLTQVHHHHRLPNQHPPSKLHRTGYSDSVYNAEEHSPSSVVGQPGMPQPAARPKGPKHKFTPADDALLLQLKETKGLMWKQIESFFPGRSSGTLQVRYCTNLKAKPTVWTEDMVSLHPLSGNEQTLLIHSRKIKRVRQAIEAYEHDRWRVVSGTMGIGFSPSDCKGKADELCR